MFDWDFSGFVDSVVDTAADVFNTVIWDPDPAQAGWFESAWDAVASIWEDDSAVDVGRKIAVSGDAMEQYYLDNPEAAAKVGVDVSKIAFRSDSDAGSGLLGTFGDNTSKAMRSYLGSEKMWGDAATTVAGYYKTKKDKEKKALEEAEAMNRAKMQKLGFLGARGGFANPTGGSTYNYTDR